MVKAVTHPNRKAHYNVRLEWTNELFDSWSDDVDISSGQCQIAYFFAFLLNWFNFMKYRIYLKPKGQASADGI